MNTAVVYKATNKITGKIYIGYDPCWPKRKIAHKTKAKNGSNLYFHCAIRKYGWENFDWMILKEEATLDDEIRLIEHHQSHWEHGKGYNLTLGGEGAKGYKHSPETKKKIGQASLGNRNTRGKSWKKTPEQIERSRVANSCEWEVTTPEGHVQVVRNLRDFCRNHQISAENMWKVSKGIYKQSSGYKCRNLTNGS